MGFEESLIRFAAPTLAGVKVAALYNHQFRNMSDCLESIKEYNLWLNRKGVFIELMRHNNGFYLLYVYRKKQLVDILNNKDIRLFLDEYGYSNEEKNISCYVDTLKNRIRDSISFPHEMGVFLGYPLADVKAFIEQKGEGYALCGEWKVYHDVQNAESFFAKLRKTREVYWRVYRNGRNLVDMIV